MCSLSSCLNHEQSASDGRVRQHRRTSAAGSCQASSRVVDRARRHERSSPGRGSSGGGTRLPAYRRPGCTTPRPPSGQAARRSGQRGDSPGQRPPAGTARATRRTGGSKSIVPHRLAGDVVEVDLGARARPRWPSRPGRRPALPRSGRGSSGPVPARIARWRARNNAGPQGGSTRRDPAARLSPDLGPERAPQLVAGHPEEHEHVARSP